MFSSSKAIAMSISNKNFKVKLETDSYLIEGTVHFLLKEQFYLVL